MKLEIVAEEAQRAERRCKQSFLKERIIQHGYKAEDFHAYMLAERPGGDEVDNWTLDELECHVAYFQHQQGRRESSELHPAGDSTTLFVRRIPTAQIGRSGVDHDPAKFRLKSTFVKSLGLFRSSCPAYAFDGPSGGELYRLQEHFEWLAESLEREFPFTPLPPVAPAPKILEKTALESARQRHEQFLRDCLHHPLLRHSRALELFLTARSTAEFSEKARNFTAYLERGLFLAKNASRRVLEANGRDLLAALPTVTGQAEVKLSPLLQESLRVATAKLAVYHAPLARLEKLFVDLDRHLAGLLSVNTQVAECLRELGRQQGLATAALAPRPATLAVEESCCGVLAELVVQLGSACCGLGRRLEQQVLAPLRHLRDYSLRVAAKIRARDDLLAELKSWRRDLAAKLKGLATREQLAPADPGKSREVSAAQVVQEELAQFRRFGDVCGFVNLTVFREVDHFDSYAAAALLEAVASIGELSISDSLKSHEVFACAKFDAEQARRLIACKG